MRVKSKKPIRFSAGLIAVFLALMPFGIFEPSLRQVEILPIYPDYSEKRLITSVKTDIEPISEHRFLLTVENTDIVPLFVDFAFELYAESGERIPIQKNNITSVAHAADLRLMLPPGGTDKLGINLSLLYDRLPPGTYILVKSLTIESRVRPVWEEVGVDVNTEYYISTVLELPSRMSKCDYPAEPVDTYIVYYEGMPTPDGLRGVCDSASETGCTLLFENTSADTWYVCDDHVIYQEVKGEWLPLLHSGSWGWTAVEGIPVASGDIQRLTIKWNAYDELEPGNYLVVNECYRTAGNPDSKAYSAIEFSISKR